MLIEQYVRLLERRACGGAVVLIWLGAAALGVISARPLLAALGTHVPPVPGSATERAQNALNTAFPALQTQDVLAVRFWGGQRPCPLASSSSLTHRADFLELRRLRTSPQCCFQPHRLAGRLFCAVEFRGGLWPDQRSHARRRGLGKPGGHDAER